LTLTADEFLRRFLLHVVPLRFMRIRHFGLPANRRRRATLARCRELLAAPDPASRAHTPAIDGLLTVLRRCPVCQVGQWVVVAILPRGVSPWRLPADSS
jgi:hypothetical protein